MFDLSYFLGKSYFENDGMKNYLLLQPALKWKSNGTSWKWTSWKSNGLSEENITPSATSNNSLAPGMTFLNGAKIKVKFDGGCLEHQKISFYYGNTVNVSITYEMNLWLNDLVNLSY